MKKKILAILLGALMLTSMIPVTGMADAVEETNLLPNGSFEADFVSRELTGGGVTTTVSVPAGSWDTYKGGSSVAPNGTISQVTSDTIGEGDSAVTVNPAEGEKFLKITLGSGSDTQYMYFYKHTNALGLKDGAYYNLKFSYYYADGNALAFNGICGGITRTGILYGAGKTASSATNGWRTADIKFRYTENAADILKFGVQGTGGAVVYLDDISLTFFKDSNPNSVLSVDGTFEIDKDVNGTGDFITHGSAASGVNYDVVADPTNPSNTVLKQLAAGNARGYLQIPVKTTTYGTDDLFKVTFRFYVESDTTPEANYSVPVEIREDGKTATAQYLSALVTITPAQFNTWHTYEAYVTPWDATNTATRQFGIRVSATYSTLYDDFEVEPVKASAIELAENASISHKKIKNASNVTDTFETYVARYISSNKTSFAAGESVKPLVVFAPAAPAEGTAVTKSAIAVLAVYKNEGDVRTFVDVKIVPVSALEGATTFVSDLELTLGELDDADYNVECFLWETANLAPIAISALNIQ